MPDGHRKTYIWRGLHRTLDTDDEEAKAPSPAHTSDSEATIHEKGYFFAAFARVCRTADRWKRQARWKRGERRARLLANLRLLPRDLRLREFSQRAGHFL